MEYHLQILNFIPPHPGELHTLAEELIADCTLSLHYKGGAWRLVPYMRSSDTVQL